MTGAGIGAGAGGHRGSDALGAGDPGSGNPGKGNPGADDPQTKRAGSGDARAGIVSAGDASSADAGAGDGGTRDAGAATVDWLTAHHRRPVTATALAARLPHGADLARPETMARALAALGLRSRLVQRRAGRLDAAVVPAVLFTRSGTPLILTGFGPGRRTARLIDPAAGGLSCEEPLRRLSRRTTGAALLVTVDDPLAERRLDGDAGPPAPAGHWFWAPVRRNWPALAQVLVASAAANLLGLALPLFVMNVYDRVIPNAAFVTLWTLAIGVALAIGLDLLLRAVRAAVLEAAGRRLDTAIASDLFARALRMPMADRDGGTAGLISHIRDFEQVREFFASASFVAVVDLLFIGVFLGVMWLVVGPLALVPLIAVPVVLLLAGAAQIATGRAVARGQALAGRRQAALVETLSGLETVKAMGAAPVLQAEWDRATAAAARVNGRARFWAQFSTNGTQVVLQAVSVGIIVWGVYLVAEGRITIGALIAANILAGRALAPLGTIAQTVFRAQYAIRALGALSEFMAQPVEGGEVVHSATRAGPGALSVRKLTVRHAGSPAPALDAVDLELAPGAAVAILGRVGSGKTTLGRALANLVPAASGTVLLDGRGIDQYDPAELRESLGYLPQEPVIFTGTLRENLTLGRPDASEAEIARALRLAALDEMVDAAPEGLEMFAGERGGRLSGGQRQALALARLLLRRPRLLFLDEPTSAMDRDMEAAIARGLAGVAAEGTGLILCTHRPTLAAIAPRLVVLDRGRKVMDGPRAEVLAALEARAAQTRPTAGPRAAKAAE